MNSVYILSRWTVPAVRHAMGQLSSFELVRRDRYEKHVRTSSAVLACRVTLCLAPTWSMMRRMRIYQTAISRSV